MILSLLEIGIPYDTIMVLDEETITQILAVRSAIVQKQSEDSKST